MDFKNNRLLNSHLKMFLYLLYSSRFRIGLFIFVEVIMGVTYSGNSLMNGIDVNSPLKIIPIRWFFILLCPQFMLGDSPRRMVKAFFPIHIRFNLANLVFSVFLTSSSISVISGLLILFKCKAPFSTYTFFVIWVLTVSFALVSLFIKPIYLHLLSVITLIFVTYLDWPKFLGRTMIIRFQNDTTSINYLVLGITLLLVVIFTQNKIKKLDFYL